MKILVVAIGILLFLPNSVLAVSPESILHATASQEFCNNFTENVWQEEVSYEDIGTDTTTWTFFRDGTFHYEFTSDYSQNASGKWFIKHAQNSETAEVYLLVTDDDSAFVSVPSSLYTATLSGGHLLLLSPSSGNANLLPQKKTENSTATCMRDQVESRRTLRVIEKMTASAWGNEDFTLDFKTEPIFARRNGDRLQRGNWDVNPQKKTIVLKGIWQEYPWLARNSELTFRYAFRGNRLILTFVDLIQNGESPSTFKKGDKIVLQQKGY